MRAALAFVAVAAGCAPDESVTRFAGAGSEWSLVEIAGQPADAASTLVFEAGGGLSGQGPCNAFSAPQTAPYPWIAIGPIAASRRACPALTQEAAFFSALSRATQAEVAGDMLILSTDDGPLLVFARRAP